MREYGVFLMLLVATTWQLYANTATVATWNCDIFVSESSSSNRVYRSLDAAVEAASAHDTICIEPGTYSSSGITITKSISIVGIVSENGSLPTLSGNLVDSVLSYAAEVPVEVSNVHFTDCMSNEGGAISASSAAALISNCIFTGCEAWESLNISYVGTGVEVTGGGRGGGAILLNAPHSVSINGCTFISCLAKGVHGQGGAVSLYWGPGSDGGNGVSTVMTGNTFVDCVGEGVGGGVLIGYASQHSGNGASHTFEGNSFYGCVGQNGGGGGILVYYFEEESGKGAEFIVQNNTFWNCSAGVYGGGSVQFYLKTGQYGTGGAYLFRDNFYGYCTAQGFGGGAIAMISLDTTVNDFELAVVGPILIQNDVFLYNTANAFGGTGGGGAIALLYHVGNLTVVNTTFEGCTAVNGAGGGALAFFAPQGYAPFVVIQGSRFEGCSSQSSGEATVSTEAGALLVTSCYLIVTATKFIENQAENGGDIKMNSDGTNSAVVLLGNTFVIPNEGATTISYSLDFPSLPLYIAEPMSMLFTNDASATGAGLVLINFVKSVLNSTEERSNTAICPPGHTLYMRNDSSGNFNPLVLDTCTPGTPFGQPHTCLYETVQGGMSCSPCESGWFSSASTSFENIYANCQQCGFGLTCEGGASLSVRDGYWINPAVAMLFNSSFLSTRPSSQQEYLESLENDNAVFNPFVHLCPGGYCCSASSFGGGQGPNGSVGPSLTCPAFVNGVFSDSLLCSGYRTGTLCGSCISNYTFAFGTVDCVPKQACESQSWRLAVALILLITFSLLYVIYLLSFPERSASAAFKTLTYFFNTTALLYFTPVFVGGTLGPVGQIESGIQSIINIRIDGFSQGTASDGDLPLFAVCVGELSSIGRMVLFYVIPLALFVALGIVFGIRALAKSAKKAHLRRLSSYELAAHMRSSGLIARMTKRRSTVSKVKKLKQDELTWKQALLPSVYNLIVLSYSTLLDTSVRLLLCETVYDEELNEIQVMLYAGDNKCWIEYPSLAISGIFILILLVTLPFLLILWQSVHRHTTNTWELSFSLLFSKAKHSFISFLRRFCCDRPSLRRGISAKTENTRAVDSVEDDSPSLSRQRGKLVGTNDYLLVIEAEVEGSFAAKSSEVTDRADVASTDEVRRAKRRTTKALDGEGYFRRRLRNESKAVGRALAVIERPYKSSFWWWEAIFLLRRLAMSLVYTFIGDPLTRSLVLTTLSVLFFGMHTGFRPFRSRFDNVIEAVSLMLICLLSLLGVVNGVFLSAAVQETDERKNIFIYIEEAELVVIGIGVCYGVVVITQVALQRLSSFLCCNRKTSSRNPSRANIDQPEQRAPPLEQFDVEDKEHKSDDEGALQRQEKKESNRRTTILPPGPFSAPRRSPRKTLDLQEMKSLPSDSEEGSPSGTSSRKSRRATIATPSGGNRDQELRQSLL